MTTLCVLLAVAVPAIAPGSANVGAVMCIVGVMRFAAGRMADQRRALVLFEWTWVASFSAAMATFSAGQAQHTLISHVSAEALAAIASLILLYGAFLRLLLPHHAPRLVLVFAVSAGWASFSPPLSVLGTPQEPILATAAMLVGELLGHALDVHRRRSYLERFGPERVRALALEATARGARKREQHMALRVTSLRLQPM